MELISIIIPTYKTNDSLIRAIDSCLNQTYKNLEVVVVDDNIPESKYRNIAEKIMSNYNAYSKNAYDRSKKFDYRKVNRKIFEQLNLYLKW